VLPHGITPDHLSEKGLTLMLTFISRRQTLNILSTLENPKSFIEICILLWHPLVKDAKILTEKWQLYVGPSEMHKSEVGSNWFCK
jgi:hypothetical protein